MAKSVCEWVFCLLVIWHLRLPRFKFCIQQRKTTCPLSIRKCLPVTEHQNQQQICICGWKHNRLLIDRAHWHAWVPGYTLILRTTYNIVCTNCLMSEGVYSKEKYLNWNYFTCLLRIELCTRFIQNTVVLLIWALVISSSSEFNLPLVKAKLSCRGPFRARVFYLAVTVLVWPKRGLWKMFQISAITIIRFYVHITCIARCVSLLHNEAINLLRK